MPIFGYKETSTSSSMTTPAHADENTAPTPNIEESPPQSTSGPMLMQGTGQEAPGPFRHPREEFSKEEHVQKMAAFCKVCQSKVVGTEALNHLYFGSLKCTKCSFILEDCSAFQKNFPTKNLCKEKTQHNMYSWSRPVMEYLTYCTHKDLVISRYCQNASLPVRHSDILEMIKAYLQTLLPLSSMVPWKSAFSDAGICFLMKDLASSQSITQEKDGVTTQPQDSSSNNVPTPTEPLNTENQRMENTPNHNVVKDIISSKKIATLSEAQMFTATCLSREEKERKKGLIKNRWINQTEDSSLKSMESPTEAQKFNSQRLVKQTVDIKQTLGKQEDINIHKTQNSLKQKQVSQSPLIKRKLQIESYHKNKISKIVPDNVFVTGHYLVVHYPKQSCPEECPNCYCPFLPQMSNVNLFSYTIDFRCPDCHLWIYIVLPTKSSDP